MAEDDGSFEHAKKHGKSHNHEVLPHIAARDATQVNSTKAGSPIEPEKYGKMAYDLSKSSVEKYKNKKFHESFESSERSTDASEKQTLEDNKRSRVLDDLGFKRIPKNKDGY